MPALGRAALGLALALALGGCGGSGAGVERESEEAATDASSADLTVCAADATPAASPYAGDFPADWPFPDGTIVHDAEDRGDSGTVVTGVVAAAFDDVLDFMNTEVVGAGFVTQSGETEEDDAEAEWAGNGYRGRWVIRESTTCAGETVVQVLAAPGEG